MSMIRGVEWDVVSKYVPNLLLYRRFFSALACSSARYLFNAAPGTGVSE